MVGRNSEPVSVMIRSVRFHSGPVVGEIAVIVGDVTLLELYTVT